MRVINMAHGEFVMIGAYMTYVIPAAIRGIPAGLHARLVLASQRRCSPLRQRSYSVPAQVLVIFRLYGRRSTHCWHTWGISLILQQAARSIFGAQGVNVNAPKFLSGGLAVAWMHSRCNRLFILGLVLVCLGGVGLLMYRTA